MKIWIDGDACPVVIKEILFRAAERTQTTTTLIANQPIRVPPSPHIRFLQVGSGFDVADDEIVRRVEPGIWSSPPIFRWRPRSSTKGRRR